MVMQVDCLIQAPSGIGSSPVPFTNNNLNVMELEQLDYDMMAKVAVVMRGASEQISQITGQSTILRIHGKMPKKLAVNQVTLGEKIRLMVAELYEVSEYDLQSPSRKKPLPDARGVGMIATHRYTRLTLKGIGELYGGRDHSTVSTRIADTLDFAEWDKELAQNIQTLLMRIESTLYYHEPQATTNGHVPSL